MSGMDIDLDALKRSKLIGYGAGLATLLTLRETPLDLEFIVDDSPESQGTKLFGIPIVSPAELDRVNLAEYRVVIFAYTGSAIRAIGDRLAAFGLSFPEGWIDCSLLHFESYRRRLKASLGIDASPELFAMARLLSHLHPSAEPERLCRNLALPGAAEAPQSEPTWRATSRSSACFRVATRSAACSRAARY